MPSSRSSPSLRAFKRAPRLARLRRRGRGGGSAIRSLVTARAGSRTTGGPLPGGRLTRPLGALVFFILLALCLRGFFGQRFPFARQLERAARAQYIPQLEKQLGQKIEVGAFSTDWLGRVHVQNIVVGRDPRLPTGALMQAKSATISLDIVGLALGRAAFPDAVTSVDLEAPQLYLKRDAKGFNVESLFRSSSGSTLKTRWTGHIGLHGARLFYVDEVLRSRANEALQLDARGVESEVEMLAPARDTSAWEFDGNAARAILIGAKGRTELGAFPLRGRVAAQDKHPIRGWVETQTPVLSAPLLASWVRGAPAQVESGTVEGRVQLAFVGAKLAPRGKVVLEGVALRVPRPHAPAVFVSAVSGPLSFVGTALQSDGLSARVAGTNWRARGRALLVASPSFVGDVSTRDLSLAGARQLLPSTLPPSLRARQVEVSAHVGGTFSDVRASGNVSVQSAHWNDEGGRVADFSSVRATGAVALQAGHSPQLAARFAASGGQIASPFPKIERATLRAALWSGTIRGAKGAWNLAARVGPWQGNSSRLGQSAGQSAHLVAQSDAGATAWRGGLDLNRASTSGLHWAALFPQASAIARSGEVSAQVRFSFAGTNWNRAHVEGAVSLSDLTLSEAAIPISTRAQIERTLGGRSALEPYLSARAIRANVSLADGRLRVSNASAQTRGGQIRGALQTPLARFAPQFWVAAPALQLPSEMLTRLARAQGIFLSGDFATRGAVRAKTVGGRVALEALLRIRANRFEARGAAGGARVFGQDATIDVAGALDSRSPTWTAEGTFGALQTTGGALGASGIVVPPSLSGARAANVWVVASFLDSPVGPSLLHPAPQGSKRLEEVVRPTPTKFRSGSNDLFQSGKFAYALNLSAARAAIPFFVAGRRSVITIRDASAAGQSAGSGGFSFPRVGFVWGQGARVDGSLRVRSQGVSGRFLARGIEARQVESFLRVDNPSAPLVSGSFDARATISTRAPIEIRAQMARGAVSFLAPNTGRRTALSVRALGVEARASAGEVRVLSARANVGSALVEGEGHSIFSSGQTSVRVRVADLSLAPYAGMLGAPSLAGWGRGNFSVGFDAKNSRLDVSGPVHLDGGAWKNVALDSGDAQVNGQWNARTHAATLSLQGARGNLEGASWSGSLSLDTARNEWKAEAAATNVSLLRMGRVRARLQNARATGDELLRLAPPIEGVASGQVSVGGTLFGPTKSTFAPRASTGFARVSVPRLGYDARTLGALDGTLSLAGGRLSFAPLLLRPIAGTNESDAQNESAPSLSLLGSVPVERGGGPLDVRLSVGEAPLSFFAQGLIQGQNTLALAGFDSPYLNSAAAYVANLPRGLRGRVALEAALGGTWDEPLVRVSSLTLRDGRAPLPMGGLSFPATLDAAFTLQKGDVTFERAQFRLAKAERDPSKTPVVATSPPAKENSPLAKEKFPPTKEIPSASAASSAPGAATPAEGADASAEDDTLVQVQSGGKLSLMGESDLNADVLNANLSQLAPWVPALRDSNGAALLKGQLEGFSVRVQGPLSDPRVTGSVEAQNIEFGAHDIERLRVSRFEIGGGVAKIEPGNLSIKEERFESSAASGSVAWDWKRPGPVPDGPLSLRFPLATRDFGALAALFLPQLQDVRADEFSGLIEVGGSVSAPQFDGQIALKNAAFRVVSSPGAPLALAAKNLSGALRFGEGNRLVIDADNPLRGELVAPDAVEIAPKNVKPALPKKSGVRTVAATAPSPVFHPAFGARGAFEMRGGITLAPLDFSQLLSDPTSALAANLYDLRFDLRGGALDAQPTSGARDIALCALLRTANPQDAVNSQTLRWMLAARGVALGRKVGAGEVVSRGALRLRNDFAAGFPSLARSTPLAWSFPPLSDETGDGRDSDAAKRLKEADFSGERPQLLLREFAARATGYGSGVADGRLFLDKQPVRAPNSPAARVQVASLSGHMGSPRLFEKWAEQPVSLLPLGSSKNDLAWGKPLRVADQSAAESDEPLRVAGDLTVSNAQIVGGGSGGDGQVTKFSLLPDAPRLDVRLALGEDVELVNSTLRARLVGDLALTGAPDNPLLLGTVSLLDGQVRFPNARARVEQGTVAINVARDPETDLPRVRLDVDALARGQSGRYTVTLRLRGPLQFDASDKNKSNLQIDVSSNPPLSQDEAFAQLLGISPRDFANSNGTVNVGAANQAYAQAVLQLVSAPFFSGFERSVAQALGLSNVSFEYRFNEPLAFEVSKSLNDRVAISYRRSLGATTASNGRTPYQLRIDYRIKGDYFLGIQTDERNIRAFTLQKSFRF